ncbi:MAG: glutathione S-transferase family protein [Gloeocapsa sp. UFS-A4-WI-NPMV-4B04]|jgi:glutathione S-transferase|nr:glutathione S-transferase family protein [Gloeocapsa sp. UFS-A4-WI-NPMV-4B04]
MLKLYHEPISFNSRRVWIALLEKKLDFELIELKLDGDQFQPDFVALNPFHLIPVLVDDSFRVIESLAILDYLEAKYPTPAMLPTDPQNLAIVRMVEMVITNEFAPAISPLFMQMLGVASDESTLEEARQRLATGLSFLENLLGDYSYYGGEQLSLADIFAGTVVSVLHYFDVSLDNYPLLSAWCERLEQRPAWVETAPSARDVAASISRMKAGIAEGK